MDRVEVKLDLADLAALVRRLADEGAILLRDGKLMGDPERLEPADEEAIRAQAAEARAILAGERLVEMVPSAGDPPAPVADPGPAPVRPAAPTPATGAPTRRWSGSGRIVIEEDWGAGGKPLPDPSDDEPPVMRLIRPAEPAPRITQQPATVPARRTTTWDRR